MNERGKKVIAFSIVTLLVAVVGLFAYRWWNDRSKEAVSKSEQQIFVEAIEKTYETDKDFDGLFDTDEVNTHHTDPSAADTDEDGLLDGDEVTRYKTDPKKADTHGIGHSDSWGVAQEVILLDGKVDKTKIK
jgi:hypothetical protein